MKKWNVVVAAAMGALAGCMPIMPKPMELSGEDQLAFSHAEQQCQLVHRHAQFIAKDTNTGRATFHCIDS
jgi:hypothetical protein